MIEFHYQTGFRLINEGNYRNWVSRLLKAEDSKLGSLAYIFTSDAELLEMNRKYLDHDYFTDILTFDYTEGNVISGDIFISVDRLAENATLYENGFHDELLRVMAHGVLHLLGYSDSTEEEGRIMREAEDRNMKLFHVEH